MKFNFQSYHIKPGELFILSRPVYLRDINEEDHQPILSSNNHSVRPGEIIMFIGKVAVSYAWYESNFRNFGTENLWTLDEDGNQIHKTTIIKNNTYYAFSQYKNVVDCGYIVFCKNNLKMLWSSEPEPFERLV